jgi:ankyrin repeat protein
MIDNQIKSGANINELNEKNQPFPIKYYFSDAYELPIFKYLINLGFDLSYKDSEDRDSNLLMKIVHLGEHPEAISFLVEKGMDINDVNNLGWTALHYAMFSVKSGNGLVRVPRRTEMEIIQLLIDNGADINQQDNDGTTPLMGSYLNQNSDVIFLLLKAGASKIIIDSKNRTASDYLSRLGSTGRLRERKLEILDLFSDQNIKDKYDFLLELPQDWNTLGSNYFSDKIIYFEFFKELSRETATSI